MTAVHNVPYSRFVSSSLGLLLTISVAIAIGCTSLRSAAESSGLVPLDSARAITIAQHNVCGDVAPGDTSCVVRGYHRSGGQFEVLLDRRPPAGNDRVLVTLRDNGSRIEVTPVDTTSARPLH